MNTIKTALIVALVGASSIALADVPVTDTTRDQRMDQALQNYHSRQPAGGTQRMSRSTSGEGPAARTEDKIKHGARTAGHTVAEGGREVGHVVANGARATGHAIHRGADKVTGKTPDAK